MSDETSYKIVIEDWRQVARGALAFLLAVVATWLITGLVLTVLLPPSAYRNMRGWMKLPNIVTMTQYQCTDFMWQEMPPACREMLAREVSNHGIMTGGQVKEIHRDPPAGNTGMTGIPPAEEGTVTSGGLPTSGSGGLPNGATGGAPNNATGKRPEQETCGPNNPCPDPNFRPAPAGTTGVPKETPAR